MGEYGVVHRAQVEVRPDEEDKRRALDAAVFQPALTSALRASEERELRTDAWAPLQKFIAADEEASTALRKLSEIAHSRASEPSPNFVRPMSGSLPWAWSFDLKPGISVFGPPYDVPRPYPTQGQPVASSADAQTGELEVSAPFNRDADGARAASASIGIALEPSRVGTISVRPCTRYDWDGDAFGYLLSAHTEGHLTLAAIKEGEDRVLDYRDITLWNANDRYVQNDAGIAWPPDFNVQFVAEPGHVYTVFVGATVSGDQSGEYTVGYSQFTGKIHVWLPFITAELRS
jgi:hypothetical protein